MSRVKIEVVELGGFTRYDQSFIALAEEIGQVFFLPMNMQVYR